jgi:hypothetical protein
VLQGHLRQIVDTYIAHVADVALSHVAHIGHIAVISHVAHIAHVTHVTHIAHVTHIGHVAHVGHVSHIALIPHVSHVAHRGHWSAIIVIVHHCIRHLLNRLTSIILEECRRLLVQDRLLLKIIKVERRVSCKICTSIPEGGRSVKIVSTLAHLILVERINCGVVLLTCVHL